jgi:hypothetical protein
MEDNDFGSQSAKEDKIYLKNVWRVKRDAKKFPKLEEDLFKN